MILPLELIELIFSKVEHKKTILNIRISNKHFYLLYKNVIDNDNDITYTFNHNCFQTINNKTKKIINEFIFKYPGLYTYREYNFFGSVSKEINSNFFELEKKEDIGMYGKKSINYNILTGKTKETTIVLPHHAMFNCSVM